MKSLKFKGDQKMHNEFLDYLGSLTASEEPTKHLDVHAIQDEALDRFSKRKEFDNAAREKYLLREAKKVFGGSMVKEWTGLSYWWDVKTVMGAMRVRVHDGIDDGDRDWREMIKLSNEERKTLIRPRLAQDTAVPA